MIELMIMVQNGTEIAAVGYQRRAGFLARYLILKAKGFDVPTVYSFSLVLWA
jgi:hypothetical protein